MSLGIELGRDRIRLCDVEFPLIGNVSSVVESISQMVGATVSSYVSGGFGRADCYGLIPDCVVVASYRSGRLVSVGVGPDPLRVSDQKAIAEIEATLTREGSRLSTGPLANRYWIKAGPDEKTEVFGLDIHPLEHS